MSVAANIALIVISGGVGAAIMLALRRRAPAGGRFTDSDRASSIFGLLGASFAILLGFVVLLAYDSFSTANRAAGDEAAAVHDMYASAALLPEPAQAAVQRDLVCYARAVIALEWPRLADGGRDERVDGWASRIETADAGLSFSGARSQTGLANFLEARSAREVARRDRLLEAGHPIPSVLIVLLFTAALVVLLFVCLYADWAEPALSQAFMMGSVAALIAASLLGVRFLDTPYGGHPGSLRPEQMRYSLRLMTHGPAASAPCDASGRPAAS
jgi:hypothetical protein